MTIRRTAGRRTAGSEWPAWPVWDNRVAELLRERGHILLVAPKRVMVGRAVPSAPWEVAEPRTSQTARTLAARWGYGAPPPNRLSMRPQGDAHQSPRQERS